MGDRDPITARRRPQTHRGGSGARGKVPTLTERTRFPLARPPENETSLSRAPYILCKPIYNV